MPDARELSVDDVRRTAVVGAGTFLAFAPLHTIFSDAAWLIEAFGAVVCVLAPAMVLRLRRGPRASQLVPGLVLLVLYCTGLYLHDSAIAGLVPGPGSWHALNVLHGQANQQIQDGRAPLPSTIALRVGVVPALGLFAALIDWAAVVRRAPALAGVALLALFTICGAVAGTSVGWLAFAVAASGFLIILSADSRVNLLRWGLVVARPQGDHPVRPRLGLSGRRIGVIAVVVAVILPAAVPGLSRNLLVDAFHRGSGSGGQGTSLSPFAALKGQLTQTSAVRLAQVQVTGTDRPFYLRSKVLDVFTDTGWRAGTQTADLDLDSRLLGFDADNLSRNLSSIRFDARVTFSQISDTAVPIFGLPLSITGLTGGWLYDRQNLTVTGGRTRRGTTFIETVLQPAPTVRQLRSADERIADSGNVALPRDLPEVVGRTVDSVTATATTPYERARLLTEYFLNPGNGFVYNLQTKAGDSGSDLVDFLQNKTGYCQQYAGALAVMMRVAGIPTRVVLGYTHPAPDKQGNFTVTSHDAHAWVEGFFGRLGWIPFDPTPVDPSRVSQLPYAPHPTQAAPSTGATDTGPSASRSAAKRRGEQSLGSSAAAAASTGSSGPSLPAWLMSVLEGLAAVALLGLVLPIWRRLRHRSRLRSALGHGRLEPVWQELKATAVDTGAGWGASTTPRQVPQWLAGLGVTSTAAVADLARAVERERYAPVTAEPLSPREINDSIDRMASTARALRARQRPAARLWTTLVPPSLLGGRGRSVVRQRRRV